MEFANLPLGLPCAGGGGGVGGVGLVCLLVDDDVFSCPHNVLSNFINPAITMIKVLLSTIFTLPETTTVLRLLVGVDSDTFVREDFVEE